MITRIIGWAVGIAAAIFFIAFAVMLLNGRPVNTNDPGVERAANRSADAAEAVATTVGQLPTAIAQSGTANNGDGDKRGDFTATQVGQILGVDPQYLTQNKKYTNMWSFTPPSPASVSLKSGWRADYTGSDYDIHSCSDIYDPGVYGTKDGKSITVVDATLLYVPGETKCPPFSTWAKAHVDGSSSSSSNSGSDSNGSADTTDNTDGNGSEGEVAQAPTPTPNSDGIGSGNDTGAPASVEAWHGMIETYGFISDGPDQYGGIVVTLDSNKTLPKGWEAWGPNKRHIKEDTANRKMHAGETWTIYPPYDWRDQLGFSA